MTEEQNKYYFELDKQVEKSERIIFYTKEFWYGVVTGFWCFLAIHQFIQ